MVVPACAQPFTHSRLPKPGAFSFSSPAIRDGLANPLDSRDRIRDCLLAWRSQILFLKKLVRRVKLSAVIVPDKNKARFLTVTADPMAYLASSSG